MQDKEIIKAAKLVDKLQEAYNAYYDTSKGMPYDIDETLRESAFCLKNALDLINRQQAELNKYQQIENTVNSFWSGLQQLSILKGKDTPTLEELLEYIEQVKAAAYKELAEILKNNTIPLPVGGNGKPQYNIISEQGIDYFLKKLTGG